MAFHFGVMPWSTYRLASLENPYELVVWQRLYPCVADEQADAGIEDRSWNTCSGGALSSVRCICKAELFSLMPCDVKVTGVTSSC